MTESIASPSTSLPIMGMATSMAVIVLTGTLVMRRSCSFWWSTDKNRKGDTPPHARFWIPYVGAGLAMGQKGLLGFVRSTARDLARKDGTMRVDGKGDRAVVATYPSVFTATVLGDACLFFADPADLMIVFGARYQKYLDVLSLQKQFVKNALGATPQDVTETFQHEMTRLGTSQYHHYLFKGQELERSMQHVQKFFLDWIPKVAHHGTWKEQKLYEFVGTAIFHASTGPLMSQAVPQSDDAYTNFIDFDKGVIALFNNVPSFFLSSAVKARDKLLQMVRSKEYWNLASPLMKERKNVLLHKHLSESSMARANLGLLWASSGNSIPAVFWLVVRLLEDPVAWQACLTQVKGIMAKRKTNSINKDEVHAGFTLEELDEMTLLESAFYESLRMYQANVTARKVVQGFALETSNGGTYWIPEGTKLMAVWSVLHMDPHVHERPEEFRYDRFVDKGKRYAFANGEILKHDSVIPFGGGSHLCPGRKFISYEARLFCAMLMTNLEFRLPDNFQRPNIDLTLQGIGVSQPTHDPIVEIRLATNLI